MTVKKKLLLLLSVTLLAGILTGCLPGDGAREADQIAGFFSGIWHGWMAPISLIFGIFNKNIHIYETLNNGWFYDLGFYAGLLGGFGGLSLSRKKKKKE